MRRIVGHTLACLFAAVCLYGMWRGLTLPEGGTDGNVAVVLGGFMCAVGAAAWAEDL